MQHGMECPVCFNEFDSGKRQPVIGSCNHSICFECGTNFQKDKLPCPECRSENAFSPLRVNYGMKDAIELLQNMKPTKGDDNLTKNEPDKISKSISHGAETTNNKKCSNSRIDENPITTTKLAKNQELFEDYNWNNLRVDPVTNIVDEDVLWQAFNKFGIIESIKITEDSIRKNEAGYANVIFSRKEDAYRAKLEMNNKLLLGTTIRVKFENKKAVGTVTNVNRTPNRSSAIQTLGSSTQQSNTFNPCNGKDDVGASRESNVSERDLSSGFARMGLSTNNFPTTTVCSDAFRNTNHVNQNHYHNHAPFRVQPTIQIVRFPAVITQSIRPIRNHHVTSSVRGQSHRGSRSALTQSRGLSSTRGSTRTLTKPRTQPHQTPNQNYTNRCSQPKSAATPRGQGRQNRVSSSTRGSAHSSTKPHSTLSQSCTNRVGQGPSAPRPRGQSVQNRGHSAGRPRPQGSNRGRGQCRSQTQPHTHSANRGSTQNRGRGTQSRSGGRVGRK